MPGTSSKPELPTHAFPSAAAFETFLEREHAITPGIHLKFAKKGSGIPSITSAEAVETALCFGWIDGQAKGIDDKWWSVRYTPRRAKSIWSQKNVGTISRLIEEGKMRPTGLAAVEVAKADGRWDRAYAGPATMTVPSDFDEAVVAEPTAKVYFASLNKTERFTVLMQLATVSDKNRALKINALVSSLAMGKTPGAAKPTKKVTKPAHTSDAGGVTKRKTTSKAIVEPKPTESEERHTSDYTRQPRRAGLRSRT
jgi:uncharacterized protein YdeI (YjbR/CyaY-like superfamily)